MHELISVFLVFLWQGKIKENFTDEMKYKDREAEGKNPIIECNKIQNKLRNEKSWLQFATMIL